MVNNEPQSERFDVNDKKRIIVLPVDGSVNSRHCIDWAVTNLLTSKDKVLLVNVRSHATAQIAFPGASDLPDRFPQSCESVVEIDDLFKRESKHLLLSYAGLLTSKGNE